MLDAADRSALYTLLSLLLLVCAVGVTLALIAGICVRLFLIVGSV